MVRCMIMQGIKLYCWYGICMMIKHMYDFIKSRMLNGKALANTKNKYILITGATDGIGKALALNFAKRKYNLIIMGRSSEKLESVKHEILQNNVECITLIKDFSQEIDFLELMEYEIGLLINNVGMCSEGPRMFIDDVRYQDIINVNLKNTFKLTQLVLIKMMQVKMGYVVNIGSITGSIPMPMLATYASSKAAIGSWTEALHTECKPWNVNVELMNTGYVATKMSGIKKSSMFCPSPDVYANCIVKHFGSGNESFAYFPHLFFAVLLFMIPRYVIAKVCLLMQHSTRKKIDMKKSKKRTD